MQGQCPRCDHRIFVVTGYCTVHFIGSVDCTGLESEDAMEFHNFATDEPEDEEILTIHCQQCRQRTTSAAAAAAYAQAEENDPFNFEDDPNQLPLLEP